MLCTSVFNPGHAAAAQRLRNEGTLAASRLNLKPLGRLDAARHLRLAISLPLRNQQALAELLAQLQDPASPNYRKYLTPAQFAQRFGPTEQDYAAVVGFAKAHGLTVTGRHPNRVILDVDGAVSDIEKTFHVTLRTYRHPREPRQFYAPDAAPTLDLPVPIVQVSGLDDHSLPRPRLRINSTETRSFQAPEAGASVYGSPAVSPNGGTAPNGCYMGNDFRAAYVPGATLTGAGQTVGLLQFDGYTAGDITYYEGLTGRPNITLTNVLLDGFSGAPTGDGGEVEVSLDIEMTMSMAPGVSNIIVYEAGPDGNWHDLLNRMATDDLAKQLSCSWYSPGAGFDPVADAIFQQMAAQGQSFYSASGDSDAFTGLISFPGDTPYITEVGGVTLTTSGAGGPYASETVWNWGGGIGSGGGISTQYSIPAWQQGISMTANMGSTTMRNVPDVALTADQVYIRADGNDYYVGGTSCAAPLWAGFTALVNQQALANGGSTVGFINPAVYAIGAGAGYGAAFHDTTAGNNFSTSSPARFPAATGYDLCTGLGTPAGMALINALAGTEPPVIVTSSPLPNAAVGAPYSETLSATGGIAPYTWSISSGVLPPGLSLTAANGVISGTPGAPGIGIFTVQVTGGNGASSTAAFNLSMYPAGTPVATTASPLASGTVNSTYSQTFSASGGAPPYYWSVASGALPSGLNLSGAGVLGGVPSSTGTFTFTVQVKGASGSFSTSPFVMAVNPMPVPPAITTASPLPAGSAGSLYSVALSATGGALPYAWSIVGGSLQPGLSLSSAGLLSGTTTSVETSTFTVQASGSDGLSATQQFQLTTCPQGSQLNGSFETGNFLYWVTSSLSTPFVPLQVNANGYSPGYGLFSCAATDGTAAATGGFDGNGPGIMQIAQDIPISSTARYLTFDYRIGWDMLTYTGSTLPRTFSVTVQPQGGGATLLSIVLLYAAPATKYLDSGRLNGFVDLSAFIGSTVRICFNANIPETFTGPGFFELDNVRLWPAAPLAITATTPISGATESIPYSQTLAATGPSPPYTWSITSGALPAGLTLSSAGLISGTATSTGTANFTVQAAGGNGATSTTALSLAVGLPSPPVITSALTATGTSGVAFSYQIAAGNNPTGYNARGLPAGLSVNSSTGMISGSATVSGTFSAAISAFNVTGTGAASLAITLQASFGGWQDRWFSPAQLSNPAMSGDTAAPAGDGIPNLMKYAFNLNPMSNGAGALPVAGVMTIGGNYYLTLTYTQDLFATDLSYVPQVSEDMQTWHSGAGYIVPVSATPNPDGVTETVVVQDVTPIGFYPGFIRLMITGP